MKINKLLASVLICILLAACSQKTQYVHVGENWEALSNLPESRGIRVKLATDKESYKVGQEIGLTVSANDQGKVWVVGVGPRDDVTLIFPNKAQPENEIRRGEPLKLPPSGGDWFMKASEPTGVNMIVVLVAGAKSDTDELQSALEEKDGQSIRQALSKLKQCGASSKTINIGK